MQLEGFEKLGIKDKKDMRCLTLWRPWAQAIIYGNKRIENRSWIPRHIINKFIFIHSGKRYDKKSIEFMKKNGFFPPEEKECETGIIGMAEICGFTEKDESPWFFGPFGWKIGSVVVFDRAIDCPGKQQLWHPGHRTCMKIKDIIRRNQFQLKP